MVLSKTSQMATNFDRGETIGLSLSYHNKAVIRFISSVITKILARNNLIYLQDTIITIMREIIVNAVKANSKRLYFGFQNLDINDSEAYLLGMESFKTFIVDNQDFVAEELKKSDYKVFVYLKKFESGFSIHVRNNTPIHPTEMQRITARIEKAKTYNDFSEVYCDVTDNSEGEGLGLVLTVLFLKNSGIGVNSLKISSDSNMTQASLVVPFQLKPVTVMNKIQQQILEEVSDLPTFPENILELEKLCSDPEVDYRLVAERLSLDPSLSVSVLKLSNSAAFITRRHIDTISEAINLIGMKNLRSIIIASSARRILDERYSSFRQIWDHCNKTAFYARQLALAFGCGKIVQNVYLAALLHDLGKIVLLSTSSALSEWMFTLTRDRGLRTSTVIEEVSIGISHSSIGEKIARKWNLPEYLVEAIQWHHAPLNCSESYRDIVYITYLANKLCGIEGKRFDYYFLEEEVLQRYHVEDEAAFMALHEDMKRKYLEQVPQKY
ncbi:MAG: HDOD domain-containing protein [Spirochaetes bacterium]|nr:HDOD domain-containing protein [Spirochaetota bacterium]